MYDSASENDSSSSTTSTRVTRFLSGEPGGSTPGIGAGWSGWRRPVGSGAAGRLVVAGQVAVWTAVRVAVWIAVQVVVVRRPGPEQWRGRRQPQGERGTGPLHAPYADLATVVAGDVLDDGQAQAGAAGGPGPRRIGPVEPLEDPVQVLLGDADALVGDGDLDPAGPPPGADGDPGAAGLYATALSTRFATAVTSCGSLPRTVSPVSPPETTEMPADSAASRVRSSTSPISRSTTTIAGVGSGSAPCSRDSSISSCTSRPSRCPSCCIRLANRRTAVGSSAASCTASASRLSAPTGVFSSWLTLATKSRRTASSRRDSVTSSSSSAT